MKKIVLIIALILMLNAKSFSQAPAQIKLGVVDSETILKELPEFQEADKKMKATGQKWQDTLLAMREDLKKKFEQYQKQKSMMATDKQQKEEESLQAINQQMMMYQEEKFGQQGELAKLREKLLEPIREKARKAIEEIAKEEKITLVLDKLTAVYADPKIELTFKVIDRLKRGEK